VIVDVDPPTQNAIAQVDTLSEPSVRALLEGLNERGIRAVCVVTAYPRGSQVVPAQVVLRADPANPRLRTAHIRAGLAEAVRAMESTPRETAVLVSSALGVTAALGAGFGMVVGIDPDGSARLFEFGADFVVPAIGALPDDPADWVGLLATPQDAREQMGHVRSRLGRRWAAFLDFDGTLAGITDDPSKASISADGRRILERLVERVPVAIISGRSLAEVEEIVGVTGITYAGSHGFEIRYADGGTFTHESGAELGHLFEEAERHLERETRMLLGVHLERKPFALTVHTRRARSEATKEKARRRVEEVVGRFGPLTIVPGKEVIEIRPSVAWHKGSAVGHLLDRLREGTFPLYIGDDVTDEDAFLEVRSRDGVGVKVDSSESVDTWAAYSVPGPAETFDLLSALLDSHH
jgi:trehalose-phosphatase